MTRLRLIWHEAAQTWTFGDRFNQFMVVVNFVTLVFAIVRLTYGLPQWSAGLVYPAYWCLMGLWMGRNISWWRHHRKTHRAVKAFRATPELSDLSPEHQEEMKMLIARERLTDRD